MISKSAIESIVNENINPEIEFVVDINVSPSNKIMVVVDSELGITIDRCVQISRSIEEQFDREKEDFELEVASAGLSEPLRVPRQYKKNIGRNVDVILPSGIKFKGLLIDANETAFTVEVEEMVEVEGKKRKQKVVKQSSYNYNEIKSVYIVISFR